MNVMKNNKIIKVISSVTLLSMITYTLPVMAYTKEEMVYVKTDAEGQKYETIVTNHIKNTEAADTIKDISDLLNIENTNGYETFQKDGDTVVWDAKGNDIYYRGETDKELPITCNIKYELDGKTVTKDEIAGKSGKVKVTLEYTNNEAHTVNVNGKNETMYTPFIVIAGTVIDNETNKNIKVTSGKIIDDGSKTIAIGMAFPGMQESLKLDGITLPNNIEFEMDASDFELGTIASFVTPKVIESEDDLKEIDKLDEVFSKVSTLESASNEILEGAKTLKEGTDEYSKKKEEFNSAMQQVSAGMSSATSSYTQIDSGISSLNKSSVTLGNGAKQISDGTTAVSQNLNLISEKLKDAETGSKKLEAGEEEIAKGLQQISTSISSSMSNTSSDTVKNLQALIAKDTETIQKLTKTNEDLTKKLTLVDATTKVTLETQIEANKQMITLLTLNKKAQEETLSTLSETSKSIATLEKGIETLQTGVSSLQAGNKELTKGIGELQAGSQTLAEKSEELQAGAKSLYNGTKELSAGTKKLATGSTSMKQGLTTLDTSTSKLTEADNQLTQGANTIKDGANTLYEGIAKFNSEGIKPICNALNGNVKNITTRAKKLGELSLQYNNYTMLEEGEEGSVQFIFLTDGTNSKSKQKEDKQEAVLNENDTQTVEKKEE